jgi:hypothetical protein
MIASLLAKLQDALPQSAGCDHAEQLARAETDTQRLELLRAYAEPLHAIIGTSRFQCATWWADAIRPGYATLVYADTELTAAITALTRLLAHHQQTLPSQGQTSDHATGSA